MNNYGYVRVAAAIPFGKVAGISENTAGIISLIKKAAAENTSIIVFPELSITSYTCGDLFHQSDIINNSLNSLSEIAAKTRQLDILSILGLPVKNNNKLFNCAAIISRGQILGIVPKSYIPGYREFYEPRWFSGVNTDYTETIKINKSDIPFGTDLLFIDKNNNDLIAGVEICEDLWMPISPSSYQALSGATILCNLSASNILVGKSDYRKELVKNISSRSFAAYIYSSTGMGESTTDVVFDADATIVENGIILSESERFKREDQIIYSDIDIEKLVTERVKQNIGQKSKSYRYIEFEQKNADFMIKRDYLPHPFIPSEKDKLEIRCAEIFNIQSSGLAKRLESIPSNPKAVIGISGGLDSTLALLVTINSFKILKRDLKDIIAITMPGFGTSSTTYNNAVNLGKKLGIQIEEIDIKDISELMLKKIEHNDEKNVVYENVQARARTYILMTKANKYNGIVIGTGDLSEIALGWSTYNADHISMYNVNSSVPKTLVKFLIKWIAYNKFNNNIKEILLNILDQPISPELLPPDGDSISQLTEDKIGPYELHDFFLYYFIRYGFSLKKILYISKIAFKDKYDSKTIIKWFKVFIKRFFSNQWKRDCVPGGPKIGSVDLSPRGSWRMPSEVEISEFLSQIKP